MIVLLYTKLVKMYSHCTLQCPSYLETLNHVLKVIQSFKYEKSRAVLELLKGHTKRTYWHNRGIDYETILKMRMECN